MNRVPAYILAGGKSSRLGSDKARVEIHGEPLLAHVARSLETVAAELVVIADIRLVECITGSFAYQQISILPL